MKFRVGGGGGAAYVSAEHSTPTRSHGRHTKRKIVKKKKNQKGTLEYKIQ